MTLKSGGRKCCDSKKKTQVLSPEFFNAEDGT